MWFHDIENYHDPTTGAAVSSSNFWKKVFQSFENFGWDTYVPLVFRDNDSGPLDAGDGTLEAAYIRWGSIGLWEFYWDYSDSQADSGDPWLVDLPDEWFGLVTAVNGISDNQNSAGTDREGFVTLDTNDAHLASSYVPTGNRVWFPRMDNTLTAASRQLPMDFDAEGDLLTASAWVWFNQ